MSPCSSIGQRPPRISIIIIIIIIIIKIVHEVQQEKLKYTKETEQYTALRY